MDVAFFTALNSLVGTSVVFDAVVIFFAVWAIYLFIPFFFYLARTCRNVLTSALIASGGAYLTNALIGLAYFRDRPFVDLSVNQLVDVMMPTKSFPSDHSAVAFAFAAIYYFFLKEKWVWLVFVLAASIAIARVIGGVHYPSDAIVGIAIGMAWGVGVYFFNNRLQKK